MCSINNLEPRLDLRFCNLSSVLEKIQGKQNGIVTHTEIMVLYYAISNGAWISSGLDVFQRFPPYHLKPHIAHLSQGDTENTKCSVEKTIRWPISRDRDCKSRQTFGVVCYTYRACCVRSFKALRETYV